MTTDKYTEFGFGREFLDQVLDWIADNLSPDDVFDDEDLDDWADRNGYVKEE